MAEKRKGKKRKDDVGNEEADKATKDEYNVAKWLKKHIPVKKTKFLYHNVEYFTGSKAVDALLTSPFADTLFSSRADVVDFLDIMLRHKFFHRALKVPVSEEELQARKRRKKGEKEKENDTKEDAESSHAEGKPDDPSASPKATKERKKKKIRLEMHSKQFFEDGLDAYVWLYEPIPFSYWIIGTLLVLGSIAICLFPLWPPEVRKGVYYLSLAGAAFLCIIIALAFIRLIIFCLLWVLTCGNHHFWLLPNLTEDVGFFASFWPIYKYEYKGSSNQDKKKKDKDSDDEQEDDNPEDSGNTDGPTECQNEEGQTLEAEERNSRSESESESSSQKSQTGKDFEMVEKDEVEET